MSDALTRQEGAGNPSHYTRWAIQPFEFTMRNGWDACAHTIFKYIVRHPFKAGLEDLKKAHHTGEIRVALAPVTAPQLVMRRSNSISIGEFIKTNQIEDEATVDALVQLDLWVRGYETQGTGFFIAMKALIQGVENNLG